MGVGHYNISKVHRSSSCPAPKAGPVSSSLHQPCHGTEGKASPFKHALMGVFVAFLSEACRCFSPDRRGCRLGLALEERHEGD